MRRRRLLASLPTLDLRLKIPISAAIVAAVLLFAAGEALYDARSVDRIEAAVQHAGAVIDAIDEANVTLDDVETAARGYALTGRRDFLPSYGAAYRRFTRVVADLQAVTGGDPHLRARIDELIAVARERMWLADIAVKARQHRGLEAAAAAVASGGSEGAGLRARGLLSDLLTDERRHLGELVAAEHAAAASMHRALLVALGICLLLVVAGAVFLRRSITDRTRRLLDGLARVSAGDWGVRLAAGKPDELGRLTTAFNDMVLRSCEAITARQLAESQLRDSEERFRQAFAEAPIGMAVLDLDGRFLRVNRVLAEILGFRPEELTVSTFQSISPPADVTTLVDLSRRLARGDISRYHIEKRYTRKDGRAVDLTLSVSLVRTTDGRPAYYLAQIEDVTSKNRAQRDREETLHRLRVVLEQAPVAVIITDDGQVWRGNRHAEELLGQAGSFAADIWGETLLDADEVPLDPESLPPMRALRGEECRALEMRLRRRDGRCVPVLVNAAPVWPTSSGPRGAVVALDDISALKDLERLRAEWNAMVVHDLRQPLSGISLQVQLIAEQPLDSAVRGRVERVQNATRRLSRMVQDLLDLSWIEARQFTLVRRPVNIADVVRASVKALAPEAADRPFELCIERAIGPISGDPDRLAQIMDNLLTNAIKYGTPGTPIAIDAAEHEGLVTVSVTNHGPGLSPEQRLLLFQRFQRAGAPTAATLNRQSVGLGLFITRMLVQAHGGTIDVESTPGQTTTFRFSIPAIVGLGAPLSEHPAH